MTPEQMYRIADSIFTAPYEWRFTEHTVDHQSGLRLWIANGPAHYRLWQEEPSGYVPRWRMKACYRYLKRAVSFHQRWSIDQKLEVLR